MGDQYDNTNTGAMFQNDKKDAAHPKWPDYNGSVNIEGVEYWLSGWRKSKQSDGKPFVSFAFKPKVARTAPEDGATAHGDADPFLGDKRDASAPPAPHAAPPAADPGDRGLSTGDTSEPF